MINIMKGLIESEKIKHYVKEFVQNGYNKMIKAAIVSTTDKAQREEEEKEMLDHEKQISEQEKYDFYKDKRLASNGIKGSGSDKYSSNKLNSIDLKPSIPKTQSQSKIIKKPIKKKKTKEATPTAKPKVKPKAPAPEKPKKK